MDARAFDAKALDARTQDGGAELANCQLRRAKFAYAARRRRDAAVGHGNLFGEPAWDILLDVFIAQQSRQEIQVSNICLEARVPSTTILRWVARLESEGLIYRCADSADGRRRHIRMTQAGEDLMCRALEALGI